MRQLGGAGDATFGEIDAGDATAIVVRQIAGGATHTAANVKDVTGRVDAGQVGQNVVCGSAAVVVLVIVLQDIFRKTR